MMVMLFAFLAFAVDVGFISLTRARLQNNADAAALAAAQQLSGTSDPATVRANARQAAYDVIVANVGGNAANANFDAEQDVSFGKSTWNAGSNSYTYQWGDQYTPYTAVKVFARRDIRAAPTVSDPNHVLDQRLPLFFAPVLGDSKTPVTTSAIATYVPRDIVLVLDFSHSMCYDSQFYRLGTISQSAIETSLQQIWQDLGSPVYGNMSFTPQYAAYHGVAASGSIPHVDVNWKGTSVDVTSTSNITSVKLQFSNNNTQTISGGSVKTGTFKGSGGNNGKLVTAAWVLSGGNANVSSGGTGEKFDFSVTGLIKALGLNNVTYPYPSGSWSEFVSYCTGSSTDIGNAGYKYKFGLMLWVNYIQDIHGSYAETPDLWKTREQPTAILKNGVNLFVNYLQGLNAGDRLGLSVYSLGTSAGAKLELGLG
ncbi:MAG TPA: pilus assembly protein TadG-related protein, partial [Planctomycetaceae bacterium]|nr:pilus assembly protein TadG-related protein [Planctomycetaceae bacterium]